MSITDTSQTIPHLCGWNDIYGRPIYTHEYLDQLRDEDAQERKKYFIAAQRGGQEHILAANADIMITGGSRGGPLQCDTRVVTPFGYKTISDLKIGDIVCGRDGRMQRIIHKSHHGMLPCYEIKFIDGSSVIASTDHLWNVRKTCYRSKKRILGETDLASDWRVWTTSMIVERIQNEKAGKNKNGHIVIPMCEPVHFTPNPNYAPKIDPYVLGALIGDGCLSENLMCHGKVSLCSMDSEIVEQFIAAGYDMSKFAQKENNQAKDYFIYDKSLCENLAVYGLRGHLAYDKFIPYHYLFGSLETRMAILQGLLDTDGCIDKRGHLSFTTVSKQLAEDVKFLVSSLGGLATISETPTHYIKNGERVDCSLAYKLYIKIKDSHKYFRLSRKKERFSVFNGGVSEYTRRIVDCEYVGMRDCYCVHVSNTDSLFLVEDFVVTHNSKSFSILLDAVKDIIHPNFNAVILRHEKPDLENIIKDSRNVFKDFGYYVSSDRDMLWRLDSGGQVQFSYHAGDINDFKIRFQGKQFSYIAVDEITHIDWEKFLYLLTTLRNAHGIRNRFVGSCNPDKSSWVRQFIDWWIGNVDTIYADGQKHPELAGYPIPERDGKVRYCFMAGAAHISDIIWGDTREEVYEKCKDKIAELWTEDMHRFGDPKDLFIMSVAFVEAKITDNVKLLESDPSYIARLANQSQDQIMRDLRGNWDADQGSDEYLSEEDMQRFFANTKQYGDGIPRASLDVAFEGGDAAWMWLRVGNHIQDFAEFHLDAQNLIRAVDDQLQRWHVQPQNFTFDTNGIGQAFKGFFKRAIPFNNMEAPFGRDKEAQRQAKLEYDCLKSQTAFMFADEIKAGNISIEPYLLQKRITAKGIDNMTLHDVLMSQRRIIAIDQKKADTYKGKCIITKDAMKKMLHYSPDAMESLLYSHVFFVKAMRPIYSRPTGSASYNFSTQRGGTIGYQHQGGAHVSARSRSRTRYC